MSTAASRHACKMKTRFGPVIVMGVSGSGKSTVGARLADYLACRFVEGDSLHPASNVLKMRMGIALDDQDRWPWLEVLGGQLAGKAGSAEEVVISCSALKRAYRDRLRLLAGRPVTFIFLQGDRALLAARLEERRDHFMPLSLLDSQLAALELPAAEEGVITVEIDRSLEAIVAVALTHIAARYASSNNRR